MSNYIYLQYLANRCGEEHRKYRNKQANNPIFCFKLFQYALQDQNEAAWVLVYDLYRPQVESWVRRNSKFADCQEDVDYFVNEAFMRLQKAITPQKFANFPELKHLLRFLALCVDSAIHDHLRKLKFNVELPTLLTDGPPLEAGLFKEEFWDCVKKQTRNEREWLFVQAYFVWGLKPRQICAEFPDLFKDPRAVNRVRTVFMDRFKRNVDEFQRCLGENAGKL